MWNVWLRDAAGVEVVERVFGARSESQACTMAVRRLSKLYGRTFYARYALPR